MDKAIKSIIYAAMEFLIYASVMTLTFLLLYLDVVWLKNYVEEISLTEISQEIMLVCIIYNLLVCAYKYAATRYSSVLLAGLFACMLIRELDSFLDNVFHGFWIYPALLIALSAIIYAFRYPTDTVNQLINYSRNSTYGYMIVGLLVILIYSRLFGMKIIWQTLLDGGYNRIVKNVVEEGTELFGYSICLVSTLMYRVKLRRATLKMQNKTSSSV